MVGWASASRVEALANTCAPGTYLYSAYAQLRLHKLAGCRHQGPTRKLNAWTRGCVLGRATITCTRGVGLVQVSSFTHIGNTWG